MKTISFVSIVGLLCARLGFVPLVALADPGQDLLVGNGTAGPYPLSWKSIDAGTEIVSVNQQTQMRGLDYTLDAAAGTVTFARPLTAQSAASVHYEYDRARAVRGSGQVKVPLSFDLAARGGSKVSFDALYQGVNGGGAGVGTAPPGSLMLGLGTTVQGGGMQLASRLLFAPALGSEAGAGSSDGGRLGLSLKGSTQGSGPVQISIGYAQAGARLGAAGSSDIAAGRQTLTLGTTVTPSKQVKASINWAQSDAVIAGGAAASTQMSAAVTVAPAANLNLQTRWTTASGGGAAETQTADIRLHAAPTAASNLDATFTAKNSAAPGQDTQVLSLAAAVAPAKAVAVKASMGQTLDPSGSTNQQQLSLSLTPGNAMQVQAGVTLHQTETAQTCITAVGGQFRPVSFLQFTAAYKGRTASAGDPLAAADNLDTSLVSVALLPLPGLRLTGSYAQNPDNGGLVPQALAQRGVGLETTLGLLSVSGGYDWQRQSVTQAVGTTLRVGVGLHLSSSTQLDGTYRQTLAGTGDTWAGSNLYGVGLKHTLGDRFSLSVAGTMQQPVSPAATATTPNYAANASLGMKF